MSGLTLDFVLFHFFPWGGLERDMLSMARACQAHGHSVRIITRDCQGQRPENLEIIELPSHGWNKIAETRHFVEAFLRFKTSSPADVTIGFNRMPGLDLYFAADTCFASKAYGQRGFAYRMTPRARLYLEYERAVFGPGADTDIMLIAPAQKDEYRRYYATPDERLHLLPPGIRPDCLMPEDYAGKRAELRARHGLSATDRLILFVGSDFPRKGLDRAIEGLAALRATGHDSTLLWVIGKDDKRLPTFEARAKSAGVSSAVRFLGGRNDVPELMWAADALVHPARSEAAGLVLLEAAIAGLPVVVTEVCGHAHFIERYDVGQVIKADANATDVALALARVLERSVDTRVIQARQLVTNANIFSLANTALDLIERRARRQKVG
jgi:UDP-glucose:(heptosyl)LPS alpha-1,3-glucosyltransferase